LTINGSGFLPGMKLLIGSTTLSGSQLLVTPTQIQVNVITGLSTHTYAVQLVNSNGLVSNSLSLQVNAPPVPVIVSVSPNPVIGGGAPQTLVINGSNFQASPRVTIGTSVYGGSQVTL